MGLDLTAQSTAVDAYAVEDWNTRAMTADFGTARQIDARAHGEPGARTFEMRVLGARDQSASLWLEKQQLQALSLALTQLLAQLDQPSQPARVVEGFPEHPEHDFRVGRMSIGFDTATNTVVLHIYREGRDEEEEDPDVLVRVGEGDCSSLNTTLQDIISSGRPTCPLCGAPMESSGSHMCIRTNGHSRQPIPEDDAEEE
jgi:uncharacterized repeat protein (TIGR03847 family)